MRSKIFSVLLLLCITNRLSPAQQKTMEITGRVIGAKDQLPLAGASIYLSNTTIGTLSSDTGTFRLRAVPPGKYDLVISYLGYRLQVIPIEERDDLHPMKILLQPEERRLQEVVIAADTLWDEHFRIFWRSFMGRGRNVSLCKMINPEVLSFRYIDSTHTLSAVAGEPLIIENKALGYKIYCRLDSFARKNNYVSYLAYNHFEQMIPRNRNERRRWESNRKTAYYGSFMHFMRSLLRRSPEADGFLVRKLVISGDSLAGLPVLYRWTGKESRSADTLVVSRSEWNKRSGFNILYPGRVPYDSIIRPPGNGGYYQLAFAHSLYVIYTKRKGPLRFFWGYVAQSGRAFPASIVTMKMPQVSVDHNGSLADPLAVRTEGYWATQRGSDMLPLDYDPEKE